MTNGIGGARNPWGEPSKLDEERRASARVLREAAAMTDDSAKGLWMDARRARQIADLLDGGTE